MQSEARVKVEQLQGVLQDNFGFVFGNFCNYDIGVLESSLHTKREPGHPLHYIDTLCYLLLRRDSLSRLLLHPKGEVRSENSKRQGVYAQTGDH